MLLLKTEEENKKFWRRFSYRVPDLPGEIWKKIPNTYYAVSNKARVKRTFVEKINRKGVSRFFEERLIKPQIVVTNKKTGRKDVYVEIMINGKQKHMQVSRLVATAFVPNPDPLHKIQVNHLDENPLNNLPENLEWATPKENANHATKKKRTGKSLKETWKKMSDKERKNANKHKRRRQVVCDGVVYKSATEFAKQNGLNRNTVGHWFTGYCDMPEEWKAKRLKYLDE